MERVPLVPGYEVLEPLGEGSSARVWRARRRADGLVVALKVLVRVDGDVAEGLREAGLLAAVRHPHVVRLYDVLPLPDPETGRPAAVAMATQLAGGGSLAQVLSRRRILSAGELVTALQPVAGALADLHGRGVVHGDLSTGNVLFSGDGMPLLSDLGAARVAGSRNEDRLGTGADRGLVAPEVVEGFPATRESDVYQLGAIAWLCLAGAPPGPVWPRGDLDVLAPGLPPGLADLVERCLEPEPGDRPDAEELALALLATTAPEPVEVAPDADASYGLTERLRQQARDDMASREEDQRRRPARRALHRLRRTPSTGGSHRAPARSGPRRAPAPAGPRRGLRVGAWAALGALLVVGAVGATSLLGSDPLGLLGRGAEVDAVASRVTAGQVTADHAPGPAPQHADEEAGSAEDAADRDLVTVLQTLVDGRALAWEEGDPDLLGAVAAPGSPALAAEAEALGQVRSAGLRYEDVSFRVQDVVLVEEDDGRMTVDAQVARAPLQGADGAGQTVVTEPESVERVRLVLARSGADEQREWLLWSWGPTEDGTTR